MNLSGNDEGAMAVPGGRSTSAIRRLLDLRMYDQALGMCRQQLASSPDNAELHQLAGVAALALEDLSTAGLHLETAVREDPEDPEGLYQLSRYWFEKGFPRRAEEAAERALTFSAYDPRIWVHLAWISYRERDFRRARERARRGCELIPDDPAAQNLLALAESECDDGTKWNPEDQIDALRELLAMDPEDAVLHHNLGLIYFQELADYEQASKHFAAAVELDPSGNLSREFLSKSLRRQDKGLRALYWPWLLTPLFKRVLRWGGARPWRWLLLAPLAMVLFFPALFALALWAVWLWPVAKGYEYLTLAEGRRAMQAFVEPGFLGIHHWPFGLRFSVLLVVVAAFWAGLSFFWHVEAVRMSFGLLVGLVMAELCGLSFRDALKDFCQGWKGR